MSNLIKITDFSVPELDIYARLTETQLFHYYEPKKGLFIAESPKVIERALEAGYLPFSFLVEEREVPQAQTMACCYGEIPIYYAELPILTKLTGFHLTGGILCAMYRKELPDAKDICSNARRIALLEHIMNPTNIGAIIRSAAALSIDAVLLTPSCCDPLYRRTIRVSMGTVFQIPWTFLDDKAPIPFLKELGFTTAAMALNDESISLDDKVLMEQDKLAIVLGSEGEGLDPKTIADCDYTVRIPMSHGVDSLNVAAASAVAFWEVRVKSIAQMNTI